MVRRILLGISTILHGVRSRRIGTSVFFLVSTGCLFLGFSADLWGAAEHDFFENREIVMESFIVGRILKTARDGPLSAGGLPGITGPDAAPPDIENADYRFQYQAYRDSLPFAAFSPYLSQNGGQGMLFGLLDGILPLSNPDKLSVFYGLTSLLSALALASILLWFYGEFGLLAGAVALAAAVLSQWLTVFGRNLWWSIWAFYLPMLAVLYFLRRGGGTSNVRRFPFSLAVFIAVLLKCLFNGYEYITTTLIMMTVPVAYYAVRDHSGWRSFFIRMLTAAAGSIAAVLTSMTILCFQIASVTGNFSDGINHIVLALLRRSYADPSTFPADYAASLTASPVDVVVTYLKGVYLDLNNYLPAPADWIANYAFKIRYLYLILLFAAASAALLLLLRLPSAAGFRSAGRALTAAVWFSMLAPLSWLILFKAHSYVHTFMNNIVWQMPFTLFGFAVCGFTLRVLWRGFRNRSA
jgi:hypothetical protein